MEQLASPYRPGFSQLPEVLAGREEVFSAAGEAAAAAAIDGRVPTPLILVGPRGVGKTVLLAEIAGRTGAEHGWPHMALEASQSISMAGMVEARVASIAELLEGPDRGGMKLSEAVLRAGVAGVGGEVRLAARRAGDQDPSLRLERALGAVAALAAERGSGVVLTVDEAHTATREDLAAFGAVLQHAITEAWPLMALMAGLPSLRSSGRLPSYFERADWHEIGLLSEDATLEALVAPAERAGRPYEPGAAERLADETGGYPYAVQLYGHHAWRASQRRATIDLAAAERAVSTATGQLERGLFAQRWQQASPKEKEYLVAVAREAAAGNRVTGGDVARRLGSTAPQVSRYRERLIAKGSLFAEDRALKFVTPGFEHYILRQA
ncbi:MAG: AAA family ATPase [Acidimicrobiales bacterium]